jgi:hypothetical protein
MKKARSSYPMSVDERDQIEASWMNSATAKRMIPTSPTTDALQGRELDAGRAARRNAHSPAMI